MPAVRCGRLRNKFELRFTKQRRLALTAESRSVILAAALHSEFVLALLCLTNDWNTSQRICAGFARCKSLARSRPRFWRHASLIEVKTGPHTERENRKYRQGQKKCHEWRPVVTAIIGIDQRLERLG